MIVGVDVSSKRIDLAWLEEAKPCRWHQELAKGHLIDRLRSIAVRWPSDNGMEIVTARSEHAASYSYHRVRPAWETTEIAIEYPFGRGNAIAALMATVGVITRQAPPWARVAWPSSGELRQAISAKRNDKYSAHDALFQIGVDAGWISHTRGWNADELDALVACVGWSRILAAQDAE